MITCALFIYLLTRGALLGGMLVLSLALWMLGAERSGGMSLEACIALSLSILVAPLAALLGLKIVERVCEAEVERSSILRTQVPEAACLLVLLSLLQGDVFFALLNRGFEFAGDITLATSGEFFIGIGALIGEKALTFAVLVTLAVLSCEIPLKIMLRATGISTPMPWVMIRMCAVGLVLVLGARFITERLISWQ